MNTIIVSILFAIFVACLIFFVVGTIRNRLVYKIRTHVLFKDNSYELSAYKRLPSYDAMMWDLRKWRARDWLGEGW